MNFISAGKQNIIKVLKFPGLFLLGLLIMTGCNRPKPNGNGAVKSMEDLVVSNNFNWKTTKTIVVNIKTPVDESNQLIKIYSVDNKDLLYTGYADPVTGMIAAKVTVPTSYNMVKLEYGPGNRYKPVVVGIGNDLVYNYDFSITKDAHENVQNITATFIVYAFGASFHNSFGFQFPNVAPNQIKSVTGYNIAPNSIFSLASNGLEKKQSKATVIVYDDSWRLMPYPGKGIGVNTEMDAPFVTPDTIVMQMTFYDNGTFAPGGPVQYNTLDIGNFNPFIVVNQQRGVEVHLPNHAPTDLVDKKLLGTGDDNSIPAEGRFYKTKKNLPWAINIPQVFVWPIEKQDITQAYNNFAEWAESDGDIFPDWYEDKAGYRNNNLLYTKQQ